LRIFSLSIKDFEHYEFFILFYEGSMFFKVWNPMILGYGIMRNIVVKYVEIYYISKLQWLILEAIVHVHIGCNCL
jgi:hypothetical protein